MSSISKRVDNLGAYQIVEAHFGNASHVPESYCYTPCNTPHVYLKRLVERYGYIFSMKDYNVNILEYVTKTLVPRFPSFLTI